jgi:hypothetical protein
MSNEKGCCVQWAHTLVDIAMYYMLYVVAYYTLCFEKKNKGVKLECQTRDGGRVP